MGCCSAKPNEKSGVVFSTNYPKAPGYLTKFELVDARSSFESFCSLARSHLAASPIQLLPVACLAVLGDPASYHGEEKQAAVSGGINAAEDLPTAWRNRMSLLTPLSEAVDTAAKAEKAFPRVLFVHSEGSEGPQKIPLLIEATSRFLKAYNLEVVPHEDKLQYIWSPALCTTLCESRTDPQALASQMLTAAHAASVFLAPPAALYPATAATLLAPPPPPPPGPPGGGGGAASPRTPLLVPGDGGRGRWEAWSAPLSSSSLLADQLAAGRWGPGQLATAAALARRAPLYHAQVIQSSNGGVQFSFDCSVGEEGYADLMKKAKRRHQRWDMVYGTAPNLKARVNHPRAIVRSGHDILLNPQVPRLLQLLRADARDLDQSWWPPGGEEGEGGEEEEEASSSPRNPPGGGGGGDDAGTGTGARLAPAAAAGAPPPPAAAKLEERRRRKREAIRQHQNTIRRAVVAAGPPAALAHAAAGLMDAWASLPPGGPGGGPWGERAPLARAWGETGGWPPPPLPPPPPGEEELRPGQLAGGEEVADHDANASAEHAINALDNQDKDDPEARAAFYGALLFLTAYHEGMLKTESEDTLQASYQYCPEPKTGMFQRSLDEYNSEESSTQKQITEHFAHNLFERGGGVGRSLVQFLSNSTPKPTPRQSPKARDAVVMAGQEGEAKESAAATAMLAAAETNRPKGGQPWGSLLAGEEGRRGEFSGSGSGSTDWGPPGSETSELVKEKGKGVLANWFGVPSPATCGTACNVRWQQILRKQSHESSSSSSGSDCSEDEQHEQKDEEEHNTLSPASPLARGCPPEEAEEEHPRPPGREEEQLEDEEEEVDERLVAQLQELLRPEPRSGLALAARALFGGGDSGGEEGRRQRRRAGEGAAPPPPRLTSPPVADRRCQELPPRPDHRPRALKGDGTGAEVMIVRSADL